MNSEIKRALAVGAVALTASTTATVADIAVATWGGVYTESQKKSFGEPWEAKTGNTVNWERYNGGLDEIRTMVEVGNTTWDVVDVHQAEARVGCDEGLFEEIPRDGFILDATGTSIEDDVMIAMPNNCVVPNVFGSYVPFYKEGTFSGEQPTTIADFFDIDKFPGKRSIQTWPDGVIEMALVADGVPVADVYDVLDTPGGIDRAFAKLDSLRGHVVFWSSSPEPIEFIEFDEAVMAVAYNGRITKGILDGINLVPIWDGQVLDGEWFVIIKGTRSLEAALDFVYYVSAPEILANMSRWMTYGPMRKSSLAVIAANEPWHYTGINVMEHLPNRAEVIDRTVVANRDWWAKNDLEVYERYTAWLALAQ